ncbi:hypothetical protein CYLTODRAFT_495359 [Cylindrobasidium torrendii FP15055 ss-10]|uniref:Uncharacterized protein n=1 Tax=Cylindrobasidium torrendii FP15055 ss-10 TaxID=1314674 RepID=A0A0D7ATR4_9AGAR|nr:hypothetical protein CYLTODRAFT_495359 [Cylindrobasidium torrendii FP15055 ss-10]
MLSHFSCSTITMPALNIDFTPPTGFNPDALKLQAQHIIAGLSRLLSFHRGELAVYRGKKAGSPSQTLKISDTAFFSVFDLQPASEDVFWVPAFQLSLQVLVHTLFYSHCSGVERDFLDLLALKLYKHLFAVGGKYSRPMAGASFPDRVLLRALYMQALENGSNVLKWSHEKAIMNQVSWLVDRPCQPEDPEYIGIVISSDAEHLMLPHRQV